MNDFLSFVEKYWFGVILCVLLLLFVLRSILKLFGWGRFKRSNLMSESQPIGFYLTAWLGRLFDDFRHVLAFLIILFFFVAVVYALVWGGDDCDSRMDATKTVIASLGGLIGSIIGYYFGESKGKTKGGLQDGNEGGVTTNNQPQTPIVPFEEKGLNDVQINTMDNKE